MNLPPELIQIIFLNLCPTKTIFPLYNDPRLLVTRVCSQWRTIALGMPDLWAHLRIPVNYPPPYDHIRAWISRSSPATLSVVFYGPLHCTTSSVAILDLIIPAIQRYASLKLCIDDSTLERLLTLLPGSLCMLRSISIRPTDFVATRALHTISRVTAFQQCPQLCSVNFEFTRTSALDPAVFELPWHQLTHLSIRSCSLREYETLDVLRQCTTLQECNISTYRASAMDIQRITALAHPVVLPCLHTLHLTPGDPLGDSTHFVHALRLPRLRSLRLTSTSWRSCSLVPLFQPLLSETVRYLDLSRWITTDLFAALALMPNLETLTLDEGDVEELQVLGGGAVVPRLVVLKLGYVTPGDLLNMLEARAAASRADGGIAAFTNVYVAHLGAGGMDAARLAAVRASGVRLVFGK